MKIPGTKNVHVLARRWRMILLPILLVIIAVAEIDRRPEGVVPCIAATVALGLIIALTQRWLTRSYMISILPWRRVRLAEAELVLTHYPWRTGIDVQMVQLKIGAKQVICPLHVCSAAEREELMQHLKSTCKSCTENHLMGMPGELKRQIAIRIPILIALALGYLYMLQVYVPISDVAKETAKYGIIVGNGKEKAFARSWYRADEAMEIANSLLMLAMIPPEESDERERRSLWYEEMQNVEGFAEKRYTEQGMKRAVELADIWYGRAAELGHKQAEVMQVFLHTCGIPPEEVDEDADGIKHIICAAESLGDALLRMAIETPSKENPYTDEQRSIMLELAGSWYYRPAQWLGSLYDHVMLAYLDSIGTPIPTPEVTRLNIPTVFRLLSGISDLTFKEQVALQICYQYGLGTEKDAQKAAEIQRIIRVRRDEKKLPPPPPPAMVAPISAPPQG